MTKPSTITNDLFKAYIEFANGARIEWRGLSFTKAHWRYHWVKRQFYAGKYRDVKTYGFQSESFNR